MNVVYAVTADYQPRILPSLRSLIEHNPDANIWILTETDAVPSLPCYAHVINVSGQDIFPAAGVNYKNRFTYINLLKVCYPIFIDADKVIHLDADTIICDSLEQIWKLDLSGKWFAACPEYTGSYKPFGDLYYNLGVAVINLHQMMVDGIVPEMVRYLNQIPQPWADQDAWNKYALEQDKAVPFAVRFNENFATGYTENPAVVHFCGIPDWWTNKTMKRREYLERYRPL